MCASAGFLYPWKNPKILFDFGLFRGSIECKAIAKGKTMTDAKKQAISKALLNAIAATGSVKAGYDKIMGEGAYDALAGQLYDDVNNRA